jgi:hypothetical protein
VRRLAAELGFQPSAPSAEEASEAGKALGVDEDGAVTIADGVYTHTPTRAARVALLREARRLSRGDVVLEVRLAKDGRPARVALDVPRRLLRRVGVPLPEPGDRFSPSFVHHFFDEEPLYDEIADAGLEVASRRGRRFVLRARGPAARAERATSFVVEVARAARLRGAAESARLREPPERAVAAMRGLGHACRTRGPIGRARLRRAIGWVDALSPRGPNCFRRVLLELALDAGAAGETLVFGLDVDATGHVAFEGAEDAEDGDEQAFDVAFRIPAKEASASRDD